MIQRLKYTWICVILWLLHVTDVCHALDLQNYPDEITAIDANNKCGTSGLENDPLVLTKITKLHGQEFWTGLAIYVQLTDWIEVLGCYQLNIKPSIVYKVESPGLCQRKCSTRYFGFDKETITCFCLNSTEIQVANGKNRSSCLTKTDQAILVYETYSGIIQTSSVENGLCTTLICTPPNAVVKDASCEGNYNIKGLCEDGLQSTPDKLWGISQDQTSKNCRNKDKLLLNSKACGYISQDLTSRAWANVVREKIDIEQTLGESTDKLKFCLSATISNNREHAFKKRRRKCTTKLEWFVCKNDSTTFEKTYHADDSKFGAVIGGILGACLMIGVLSVLIVCKVRSKVIFAKSSSDNYEDTTRVNFSTTTYDDLDNETNRGATATSNQNCDIDEYITPVYDEVNEPAKQ